MKLRKQSITWCIAFGVLHLVASCGGGSSSSNSPNTDPQDPADETPVSSEVAGIPPLNDTGIDWCADNDTNYHKDGTDAKKIEGCENVAATHPGQDGLLGRDAEARNGTLTKSGAGDAGFDFTKVCNSGEQAGEGKCPADPSLGSGANEWACTLDNKTKLLWEVKTDNNNHLRHWDHVYTWYNPDNTTNGGSAGTQDGGVCSGSDCDTYAFVQAVNSKGLCGATDWRMPSDVELQSIVRYGVAEPMIDTAYFPNVAGDEFWKPRFWSRKSYASKTDQAWTVNFRSGSVAAEKKTWKLGVRLVRAIE